MKTYSKIRQKGIVHYLRIASDYVRTLLVPKFSRMLVFEVLLADYVPSEESFDFELKTAAGIDEIMPFIQKREQEKAGYLDFATRMIGKGNLCFYGKTDGHIASCVWACFNEAELTDVHYKLEADEKTALLIDGYTLSEHRGKGIYKAVWNYCLEYLRSRGDLDRIYGFILVKNKRSLIVHRKLQLQDIILVITYLRIFGVNLHFKKKISDSG